ncbi:MAG: hypothetical protein H0W84_11895, partial [Bacteroidetes bacterium]|nr:hypothetical protein [Bacteroidota bacterium]
IKNFVPSNWVYTTWNARKTSLNNDYNITLVPLFNSSLNAGTLFTNLRNQINLVIGRFTLFTIQPLNYLPYFDNITIIEDNGGDIRPVLEQSEIGVTEYRFLNKVYSLLKNTTPSSPSPLIEAEYGDIIDILIHIRSGYLPFLKVVDEYNNGIVLDQDYFQIFKPAPVNFPITNLPVFNKWRSPYKDRKLWLDTLQGRIDREKKLVEKWKNILSNAEDENMPLMRDALIRALTNNCESWQDAGERLAKSYFVETKDNCCVKHTRVSFAIETLQGLLYSLETGIYDDFISNFILLAPNFKEEWKWIGSYATWRSAMFVYLYPENLLYPTLKRLQTPAFITLSEKLQNANRFSPENACAAAKEFQNYLEDIEELNPVCSATVRTFKFNGNPNVCCDDQSSVMSYTNFFFGHGKSGIPYWSYKDFYDYTQNGHSFWLRLPITGDNIKIIGSHVLGDHQGSNPYQYVNLGIYVFFTYTDGGKLKMAYIKRDVLKPNSTWTAQVDTEGLPKNGTLDPINVTSCQSKNDMEMPGFIFTYKKIFQIGTGIGGNTIVTFNYEHVHHPYNYKEDVFDITSASEVHANTNYSSLLTAVRLQLSNNLKGLAMVFDQSLHVSVLGRGYAPVNWTPLISSFQKIIGVYESKSEADTLMITYLNSANVYKVSRLKIYAPAFTTPGPAGPIIINAPIVETTLTTISAQYKQISRIYPSFVEYTVPDVFAMKAYTQDRLIAGQIYLNSPVTSVTLQSTFFSTPVVPFVLVPEKLPYEAIQSADCIQDMNIRTLNVKTKLQINSNIPTGTSTSDLLRTNSVKELLYEAYYFVPMLLALDQQKRGQFDTALSWY